MSYQQLTFRISGVAPLIQHNGQTADPLNQHAKDIAEIAGKRKKVEADHKEMAKREWLAGLYLSGGAPCIPAALIEAALIEGAKKEKRGPQAKAGIVVEQHAKLEYDGPRKIADLWNDERFRLRVSVRVGQSRVMRTRPLFDKWSAEVLVKYLPGMVDAKSVRDFLLTAGDQIGIGDWRPRFGRFTVQ